MSDINSEISFIPASAYSYDQLAEIYNQSRVDYIVPMPMNGKRMAEYVEQYDVVLDASAVAVDPDQMPLGVIMLGIRGDRSWITRLGIVPERRRNKAGQLLMEFAIETSRKRQIRQIQLEVIKGNLPAYHLFTKLGFMEWRELLVTRRPPGSLDPSLALAQTYIEPLSTHELEQCLSEREPSVAWTEESASLQHAPNLKGLRGTLPSGETGWLIYQTLPFQLTHIILKPALSAELGQALIYNLHQQNPLHDTKIENIPDTHPTWPIFQKFGYLEVFRRIEMSLLLRSLEIFPG